MATSSLFLVDQRPFKKALANAITLFEVHQDFEEFKRNMEAVFDRHPHYLDEGNVQHFITTLLEVNNPKRARQFVSHIPDETPSRLVVGTILGGFAALILFVLFLLLRLIF